MWAQIINAVVGVWLMAAPSVIGYGGAARVNDRIVGPIAATFAIIAISEATRPVRWANVATGLWLLVVPWVLGHGVVALSHSLVTGVVLIACASVRGKVSARFGGGWAAVLDPAHSEG